MKDITPSVSIIVPTYNESDIIGFKLRNLSIAERPKRTQIVVIDSKSSDSTVEIVNDFAKSHPEIDFKIIVEDERKGKSAALNVALRRCDGDVIIVSDADCFWPSDILTKTLPYLADPTIGAVSGPKILLNTTSSGIAEGEGRYLDSMNLVKLGESKIGSTLLFEGGFSAFKKEILTDFDSYQTGSDDCGTVISVLEKKSRAILVPEARFYTTFPNRRMEKLEMKTRRANQLIRLYWKYLVLLRNGKIRNNRRIVMTNVLIYLFGPIFFMLFLASTVILFVEFPLLIASLLLILVPQVGNFLVEVAQGFLVLFLGLWQVALGRNFLTWKKPGDRQLFTQEMLLKHSLI
jgi:cellulose synthase/poly-beta-1,6-N-acetylglucosamine synthase-like glycosyltransferase